MASTPVVENMNQYALMNVISSDIKALIELLPESMFSLVTNNLKKRLILAINEIPTDIINGFGEFLLEYSEKVYDFENMTYDDLYELYKANKQYYPEDIPYEEGIKLILLSTKTEIFAKPDKKTEFGKKLVEILDKYCKYAEMTES